MSTRIAPQIRPRAAFDDAAIDAVLFAAFGGEEEVRLVERLRRDGECFVELVAIDDAGDVVGHILFSRLAVTNTSRALNAVSLAPLAVRPDVQRRGVGDALTHAGIAACRAQNCELIVVLGHPKYYPRFGFSALLAKLLDAPYSGPSFMALELTPGVVGAERWTVRYPPAFAGA
jgi:putative acetyltransferase